MEKNVISSGTPFLGTPREAVQHLLEVADLPNLNALEDAQLIQMISEVLDFGKEYSLAFSYAIYKKRSYFDLAKALINELSTRKSLELPTAVIEPQHTKDIEALTEYVSLIDNVISNLVVILPTETSCSRIHVSSMSVFLPELEIAKEILNFCKRRGFNYQYLTFKEIDLAQFTYSIEKARTGDVRTKLYLAEVMDELDDIAEFGYNDLAYISERIKLALN